MVVELSEDLLKWIKLIPMKILYELLSITQEIPYVNNEEGGIRWRHIDELARQISYAFREGNNPEHIKITILDTFNKDKEIPF